MGPLAAITTCVGKFARFTGRTSRPEFWWFFAFFVLMTFAFVLLVPPASGREYFFVSEDGGIGRTDNVLPPTALVAVCALMLLLFLTRPSQPGPNKYGPNPLEVTP